MLNSNSQIQLVGNIQAPDEVQIARESLASLSPDDAGYLAKLEILAKKLASRFARLGNPGDLDEAVAWMKQVLDLAPAGHSYHIGALSNVGQLLTKRFKFRGDPSDLAQAIGYFETAVESCTPDQTFYVHLVANFCSVLLNRYQGFGEDADLDRIIEMGSFALSTSSVESPNRDALLNNLANALEKRFEKRGNRHDLDTAFTYYQSCLELRPPSHPLRHSALGNLANAFLVRFEVDGHLQDLENAANHFVAALQLLSPGQDGFLLYLTSLGAVYVQLYNALGDREKLEMAIDCYRIAMEHSMVSNLDHSRLLDNYSDTLRFRYSLFGNIDDLNQAIRYLTTSSEISPLTYSGRPLTLFHLATALLSRFNATSNVADLDSSMEKFASAIQSCGPGHHQRSVMLSMYGCALSARFKAKGDIQDLSLAVSTCKEALALVSPTELNYSSTIGNVSAVLYDYFFYKSGNMKDMEFIIDHCNRVLAFVPPAQATFVNVKILRAKAFLGKSLSGEDETGIGTSIDAFRDIITTLPKDHGEYVQVHLTLGLALQTRFQWDTNAKGLDEAIAYYRIAQRSCSRGHTNYVHVCLYLGNALREGFDNNQDSDDALDEAIVLLTEAEKILSVTPEHIDYKASLANLGIALFMRFQAQRSREDLETAIEHLSHALTLSGSFEEYLVPFALATVLSARYSEHKDPEDLQRSVKLFSSAADQMPRKHRFRGPLCRNFGSALFKISDYYGDPLPHINAAIALYKQALQSLPPSHYDHLLTLMRIAEAEHKQAQLSSNEDGLYGAIKTVQDVIPTLSKDDPMFHDVCHTAAKLSMSTWKVLESRPSFLEDGFRYYEKAASYTYHRSFTSVSVALDWLAMAEEQNHSSTLLAYQTCLSSLNHHLLSNASVKSRRAALLDRYWVKRTGTLATDATACAVSRGKLELAVELSEQGRGLLWSQIAQSRTPLDALRSASDAGQTLAYEFERVSGQLAQIAVAHSDTSFATSRLTMEEARRRYRQLSREIEDIIVRIRRQEGFQSFLDRPSFQDLQRAALGGPVILINASRQRCDALIVIHDAPPRLVPLPNTTLEDLTTLSENFYHMLKATSHIGEEKIRERQLVVYLRTLWEAVVGQIVDELTRFLPRGARIWWCPTSRLTSLPLHAAGPYRKGALNLANVYVSSYTPTLAALIRARGQPPTSESTQKPPAFVAIGQAKPSSSTAPELQTVDAELSLVHSIVPPSMPFSVLSSDASTGDAVLTALGTHAWAHLACHGHPNAEQPFDSSFALSDRAVTILDIIGTHPVHNAGASGVDVDASIPEFAFLSACHTAVGDRDAPDEIIHLAAAMQFAGFRSVIGTMWAVDDGMAKEMVGAFYTHLFSLTGGSKSGSSQWDCTEAARALNRASKSVNKDAVSIDQRIVFIHIGA